ncbi:hypothetical protein ACS0TY_034356 [Phlomoides rotata]
MQTRGRGLAPIPIDLEIKATIRRRNWDRNRRLARERAMRANVQENPVIEEQVNRENAQRERTVWDFFEPPVQRFYDGIARPPIQAKNFEVKPALLHILESKQFGGTEREDPHAHIPHFLEYADTVKTNGVSEDAWMCRLFSFTLKDKAKEWISSITPESLDSWEVRSKKFLLKYFPPSKMLQCKMEIAQFEQRDEENINDAWERFNGLLRKCPQHGNENEQIVTFFYNGLNPSARQYVDASVGGSIFNLGGTAAREMIDVIAANSCHWPTNNGRRNRVAQVQEEGSSAQVLSEVVKILMDKVDSLSLNQSRGFNGNGMGAQQGMEHFEEANYLGRPPFQQGNFQGNNQFQNPNSHQNFQPHNRFPTQNPPQNSYNNNGRNQEKFSYANPKAALTLPHGVDPGGRAPNNEGNVVPLLIIFRINVSMWLGIRINKYDW